MLQDVDRKIYHGGKKTNYLFSLSSRISLKKEESFAKNICRNMFESCNLHSNFVHDHVSKSSRITSSLDVIWDNFQHDIFELSLKVHLHLRFIRRELLLMNYN